MMEEEKQSVIIVFKPNWTKLRGRMSLLSFWQRGAIGIGCEPFRIGVNRVWKKTCSQCGERLEPKTNFCRFCGTPIARQSLGLKKWTLLTAAALVVIVGGGSFMVWSKLNAQASKLKSQPISSTATSKPSLPQLIQKILPSLVLIQASTPSGQEIGSGFIYDHQGDIATNAHVVKGALSIAVTDSNGHQYQANLIGLSSSQDVAAIRVAALQSVNPLPLGSANPVQLGDSVVAFGSPLGLKDTVTTGVVSGMGRNFTIGSVYYQNMLQISAPIAAGNSGGPLVDQSTQSVVGIDTAGALQSSGNVGFAIPIHQVQNLLTRWASAPQSSTVAPSQSLAKNSLQILNQFYQDINDKDYQNAYNLMGSNWHQQESYSQFVQGYNTTVQDQIQNPVASSVGNGEEEVSFTLVAENQAGSASTPTYTDYQMNYLFGTEQGHLRILHGTARVVNS